MFSGDCPWVIQLARIRRNESECACGGSSPTGQSRDASIRAHLHEYAVSRLWFEQALRLAGGGERNAPERIETRLGVYSRRHNDPASQFGTHHRKPQSMD